MLSRLVRGLLLGQILVGALLGWLVGIMALALPLITVLAVVITIGIRSRTPGANRHWLRSLFFEFGAIVRAFLLQLPWTDTPPVLMPATAGSLRTPVLWCMVTCAIIGSGMPWRIVCTAPDTRSCDST